ncbi:TMEM175 family protein [Agromyces sp. MMS24-JH15]|uniref:TMEM175 family protein n=1 Tax=Agromyces sp. MMS24-JH15 TaxID=3243765 RepID=UPI003749C446
MGSGDRTAERAVRYGRDSVEFARAFTFFDAGYAIALTLLVVNLDPPPAADWTSPAAWLGGGLGWQLFGFAVSFAVIAVFWRVNHRIGGEMSGVTDGVISANVLALALVVVIPFSTQGISDPETAEQPLSVVVYAVNISLAVLAQSTVHAVARRDGVLRTPLPRRAEAVRFVDAMSTPLVFLASIPVAYAWGAGWARAVWLLLLVVGPVSGRWADRRVARIVADDVSSPTAPGS